MRCCRRASRKGSSTHVEDPRDAHLGQARLQGRVVHSGGASVLSCGADDARAVNQRRPGLVKGWLHCLLARAPLLRFET